MKAVSTLEIHFPKEEVGDKYQIVKLVGKGAFGHVAQAKIRNTEIKVAIKKVTGLFDDVLDCKRILREIIILKKIQHANLVKIIEIIRPVDLSKFNSLYIVTEYCQSDLRRIIKSQHIFLTLEHVRSMTYQILCGLKYLHQRNILHRDLKPANVLVNHDSTIKICDFGLARVIEQQIMEEQLQQGCNSMEVEKPFQMLPAKQQKTEEIVQTGSGIKKKLSKQATVKQSKQRSPSSKPSLSKQLTIHVTTRWYRAPEIILLQKNYNWAIDMWSIGCIFGELLKMLKSVCPTVLDRFPLFPGKYCYPLSPSKLNQVQINGFPHNKNDQLDMIFSTIGKPQQQDMEFISDNKAREYIKSFPNTQKTNLQPKFVGVPAQAIDFLERCIKFNPKKRLTLEEALQHDFIRPIRNKKNQQWDQTTIVMPFDESQPLDCDRLRELFIEQFN